MPVLLFCVVLRVGVLCWFCVGFPVSYATVRVGVRVSETVSSNLAIDSYS